MTVVGAAPAIEVRRAGPVDAACFASLHAGSFASAWDEASMAKFLAAPYCLCLLARREEAPAGFLITRIAGEEAEVLTLAVDPNDRRRGIGRTLLTEAMRALRAAGARKLFLEVDPGNVPAVTLYESLGAAQVGIRKGYYEHGADALIFSLAL